MTRLPACLIASLVSLPACGDPGGSPGESSSGDETSASASTTGSESGASSEAGDGDGDGDGDAFDCASVSDVAPSTVLSGPRAARGIAFDDTGHLIGAGYEAVYRSTYDSFEVLVPGIQGFGQIDRLADGDYVMANGQELVRISPDGSSGLLSQGYGDYGLRVGPDAQIYTADELGVHRVDPATGQGSLLIPIPGGKDDGARVIDFSPDLQRMYIGTMGARVWEVELDGDLNPVGSPMVFFDLSDGAGCPDFDHSPGCWHDGLGVDVCGNVYVAAYGSSSLVRIAADGGSMVTLVDNSDNPQAFGHGITWGSGALGFASDAVYLPTPQTDGFPVVEVRIGVPYRSFDGEVLNAPRRAKLAE